MKDKFNRASVLENTDFSLLNSFKKTLLQQAETLQQLAHNFDSSEYQHALELMHACPGHSIICGMGKSGHVGRKIAATLASTGTPSFFVHPAEAFHGDLGMITPGDVVLLISNSGETDEVLQLIPSLKAFGNKIIALTGEPESTLGKNADAILHIKISEESCPNNLAPTTSTTVTIAIGDGLAVALMERRNFLPLDFARFHPGGSLGRKLLTRVKDVMSKPVPMVNADTDLRGVIEVMTAGKRGMAVVMADKQMIGVITDGDLRRAMTRQDFDLENIKANEVMTLKPVTIDQHEMVANAEELMRGRHIKQLIAVDESNFPVGVVEFFN